MGQNKVSQVKSLSPDFTNAVKLLEQYCKNAGKDEYSQYNFKWFRPEKVSDLSDTEQLEMPFETDTLKADIEKHISLENMHDMKVSSGDFGLAVKQTDFLLSAARAFNEQYQPKLRLFAQSGGASAAAASTTGAVALITREADSMVKRNSSNTPY